MRALALLQRSLNKTLKTVHADRLSSLWLAVEALTSGGKLTLAELGRSSRGNASIKHRTKQMCRLLGNKRLHGESMTVYRSVAHFLLSATPRPILLLDWTPVGNKRRHHALVATTPVGGRAVTVYAEVHPEELCGTRKVEKLFLTRLKAILPPGTVPIIVTDAGFRTPWFDAVAALGWDFVGRVRQPTHVQKKLGARWMKTKTLFDRASVEPVDLGQMFLTKSKPRVRRLVLVKAKRGIKRAKPYKAFVVPKGGRTTQGKTKPRPTERHRLSAKEPWLLATSLKRESASRVVNIYKMRMQIEETFRDLKSHRFGWSFDDSRSNDEKRIEVLFLIAALAALTLLLIGLAAEASNLQTQYQANTVRNRRVFSLTYLAKIVLKEGENTFSAHDLTQARDKLRQIICGFASPGGP